MDSWLKTIKYSSNAVTLHTALKISYPNKSSQKVL